MQNITRVFFTAILLLGIACRSNEEEIKSEHKLSQENGTTENIRTNQDLLEEFEKILQRVATIRGLEVVEPITPTFVSNLEFKDIISKKLKEDAEEISNLEKLLKILQLIPKDEILRELLLLMYQEQTVGFFDLDAQRVYIISELKELNPLSEITLAHEYVHALQQQHFDISTITDKTALDTETALGLTALVEGDAVATELEYIRKYFSPMDREFLYEATNDSTIFRASPLALQKMLLFPYTYGELLVNDLSRIDGWYSVNAAYKDPPLSTEQVIHTNKYLQRELPIKIVLPTLKSLQEQGFLVINENVLGEFMLKTYLETITNYKSAGQAADGWNGDLFNLMETPNGSCLFISLTSWDNKPEAMEFFSTLEKHYESQPDSSNIFLETKSNKVLWAITSDSASYKTLNPYFQEFTSQH